MNLAPKDDDFGEDVLRWMKCRASKRGVMANVAGRMSRRRKELCAQKMTRPGQRACPAHCFSSMIGLPPRSVFSNDACFSTVPTPEAVEITHACPLSSAPSDFRQHASRLVARRRCHWDGHCHATSCIVAVAHRKNKRSRRLPHYCMVCAGTCSLGVAATDEDRREVRGSGLVASVALADLIAIPASEARFPTGLGQIRQDDRSLSMSPERLLASLLSGPRTEAVAAYDDHVSSSCIIAAPSRCQPLRLSDSPFLLSAWAHRAHRAHRAF